MAGGTPCCRRPLVSVFGRLAARPAISSEKNTPIDRAVPEFWNVARIPEAAPRCPAGALLGIGPGLFAAPNTSSIMSSVPAGQRGAASGMRATFQNSGTALSIGVFFSLLIAGLAASLPKTLTSGLRQHGVPPAVAHQIGSLPPVSSLFAAVLGVNPVQHLLASGHVLSTLPAASRQLLTGREF